MHYLPGIMIIFCCPNKSIRKLFSVRNKCTELCAGASEWKTRRNPSPVKEEWCASLWKNQVPRCVYDCFVSAQGRQWWNWRLWILCICSVFLTHVTKFSISCQLFNMRKGKGKRKLSWNKIKLERKHSFVLAPEICSHKEESRYRNLRGSTLKVHTMHSHSTWKHHDSPGFPVCHFVMCSLQEKHRRDHEVGLSSFSPSL